MSHFTRIKTRIVSKDFLLQALDDLEYHYIADGGKIRGWNRFNKTAVDIKVSGKLGVDLGFRKKKDYYEIVADFYGTNSQRVKSFVDAVNQRYAYLVTCAQLQEQGFDLVEEQTEASGEIRLVLRRAANG